jgi:hypothetical protein
MLFEFDAEFLVYSLVGAAVFHALLVVIGTKINPLFILTSVFLFVSPFSIAMYFTGLGMVKIFRVYTTVLIVLIGIVMARRTGIGSASILYLLYTLYGLSAVMWGPEVYDGFLYKGLFTLMVLGGILTASSVNTIHGLKVAMRTLLPSCVAWIGMLVIYMVLNPNSLGKRLSAYTINPNTIAASSAIAAIVCAYVALYDNSKSYKVVAYITGAMAALMMAFTGSRGPTGGAIIGCFCLLIPVVRRPALLFVLLLLALGTVFAIVQFVQPEQASRLTEFNFESRGGPWQDAMILINKNPLLGVGFLGGNYAKREVASGNMHSVFLHAAAETGLMGLLFLLICLFWASIKAKNAYAVCKATGYTPAFYLALAFFASQLAAGVVEISFLVGTTINSMMFAFSIALFDRLPAVMDQSVREAHGLGPQHVGDYEENWEGEPLPSYPG